MSKTLSRHDAATDTGRKSDASLVSHMPERQPTLDDVFKDLKSILARKDEEIRHLPGKTPTLQDALLKIERLEREIQKFHEQEISLKQKLEAKDQKIRAMKKAFKKAFKEAENVALEVEDPNADTGKSAREPDADKCAVATSAMRRAHATGDPEVETIAPPANRSKTFDSARPFQCVVSMENLHRHQERECGYLLAAESPRQEQVSDEREEKQSTGQTVQVQKILSEKEKENYQFISRNNEKNTANHEERPTSKSFPSEPNASDVCGQMAVLNDSDDENDDFEEILDAANDPDYSPRRTRAGKKLMYEDDLKYYCKCGRSYLSVSSLNYHKKMDCDKPNVDCKKCGKWFKPSSLQKHLHRNNCISKDELYCKYCHFVAQDGTKFKLHQRFCKQMEINTLSVQNK